MIKFLMGIPEFEKIFSFFIFNKQKILKR